MKFDYMALGLLTLVAVETSILLWKSPRKVGLRGHEHPVFVDTSVLMDGRIIGIAKSGFILGDLIIPRSVILELQLLADKSDHEKRERARFGLDVVTELQGIDGVSVTILNDAKATDGVDERLLELARTRGGAVMTIDYNLNKVAAVENITILNINELAQGLRMAHLPGERFSLELVDKGSDSHQAVGYLPDGTMVVVEKASSKLGSTHTVECIRSLQTVAGKMLFARLVTPDVPVSASKPKVTGRKAAQEDTPTRTKMPAKSSAQSKPQRASKKPTQPRTSPAKQPVREKNVTHSMKTDVTPVKSSRPKTSKQREASLLRTIENLAD